MVNKPKKIGTAAETAVVRVAKTRGFPLAERRTLHGIYDVGDILLAPYVIAEVKSGHQAEEASDAQILAWLAETTTEAINADAEIAFLVTKRKNVSGANAHRWWAWVTIGQLTYILGTDLSADPDDPESDYPVGLRLDHFLALLVACGYGTKPEEAAA